MANALCLLVGLAPTWGCLAVGLFYLLRRPSLRVVAEPAAPAEASREPTILSYASPAVEAGASRAVVLLLWLAAAYPLAVAGLLLAASRLDAPAALHYAKGTTRAVGTAAINGLLACGLVQVLVLCIGLGLLLRHPASRAAAWAMVAFAAASLLCAAASQFDSLTWLLF